MNFWELMKLNNEDFKEELKKLDQKKISDLDILYNTYQIELE